MDSILSSNKAFAGLNVLFRPNPFTIRAPIVNFVGGTARNKRFSGKSGREPSSAWDTILDSRPKPALGLQSQPRVIFYLYTAFETHCNINYMIGFVIYVERLAIFISFYSYFLQKYLIIFSASFCRGVFFS